MPGAACAYTVRVSMLALQTIVNQADGRLKAVDWQPASSSM